MLDIDLGSEQQKNPNLETQLGDGNKTFSGSWKENEPSEGNIFKQPRKEHIIHILY